MRAEMGEVVNNEITRNRWIWAALLLCVALVLAAIYVPALATVLELTNPGIAGWSLIIPASLAPLIVAPVVSRLARAVRKR
jgi:Ca2+-transporting ATPase